MNFDPRRFSLRLKLTASLVLVAVVTVGSAGYFTIRSTYDALRHQKQQDELVIARNIAAQADEVLRKARQTMEALAERPSIRSMDVSKQRAALDLVSTVTELIDGIVVSDLEGRILVMDQAEPLTELLLPDDVRRHFVDPIRRRPVAQFSQIYRSRKGGEVIAPINAPIFRNDELVGVLTGLILLKNHSLGGIENIRIGNSGYAYLVDSEGNALVHPQRQKVFESLLDNPAVREVLARRDGVTDFVNSEGVAVLAAFSHVAETGWGVVVRQPTAESYRYAHAIAYFLIGVFVLSLAIAVGLGIWLARKISGPVTDLVRGVEQVTRGSLDAQIPVATSDEIGELAAAFNNMTRQLKLHLEQNEKAHQRVLDTQKQLHQSEKLAAIGQLAAGLAHEINNPLNIISGFNEVLLERIRAGDENRNYLEEIARETTRCQRLVAELLNFAKPKEPERSITDLSALIEETAKLMAPQAKTLGIKLSLELAEDVGSLAIDRDQMKQVFLNLFLNACQAMPSGGTLSVSARRVDGGVRIAVRDTGVGIPQEELDDIFNPFYTTKPAGTGLGLPLSFSIVERHGGRLQAESREREGSVFTIALPAAEERDAVAA